MKYENPVTETSDEYEVVLYGLNRNIEAIIIHVHQASMASPTIQMATSKLVLLHTNPSSLPNKPITFGSNFKVHVLSSNNNGAASSCSSHEVSYFILLYFVLFRNNYYSVGFLEMFGYKYTPYV